MQDNRIRVYAEPINNFGTSKDFHIYLDVGGSREYLMTHRPNGALYTILKNGPRLIDLRNNQKSRRQSVTNLRHLIRVIDEYMEDR